jgi:hypothetical protein
MTIRDTTQAALKADPAAFIRWEFGGFGTGLKGEYLAVCDGEGRELFQIDRATAEWLAKAGVVRAGPFDQDARAYNLCQPAALSR